MITIRIGICYGPLICARLIEYGLRWDADMLYDEDGSITDEMLIGIAANIETIKDAFSRKTHLTFLPLEAEPVWMIDS